MSYKKSWDTSDIVSQLYRLSRECSSPNTDGFTSFELKKDLYLIKEVVDKVLKDSPDFGKLEQDWLTDLEQKRIIKILKNKE
jgi:hypothetical protein